MPKEPKKKRSRAKPYFASEPSAHELNRNKRRNAVANILDDPVVAKNLPTLCLTQELADLDCREKSSGVEDNDGEISKSETALEETRENLVLSECAD